MVGHSDTLLPAAWAHNMIHSRESITQFQLPRIPSFFPDLMLTLLLSFILPSWQVVALCYAATSYVALILLGGTIVSRLAERQFLASAATFLAVAALAQLLDLEFNGAAGAFSLVFAPVIHSGSFVLSLAALLLARKRIAKTTVWMTLALLSVAAIGVASDRLFVGSFLLPLIAGWLGLGQFRRGLPTIAWATLGCTVGIAIDWAVFPRLLLRQADLPVNFKTQFSLLSALVHDQTVHIGILLGAAACCLPLLWARRVPEMRFWSLAGAVSVIGFSFLLPLLYADQTAVRYVQPVWWWGLIAIAATFHRFLPRLSLAGACAGVSALLAAIASQGAGLLQPSQLARYQDPVAACLISMKASGRIHAGIAQYWLARVIEASSDWKLQVPQVMGSGNVFLWGNNRLSYLHDVTDPAKAPLFDFIVVKNLDFGGVVKRFGQPDNIVSCPETDVWLYSAPGGIGRKIGGISAVEDAYDNLSTSYSFGPVDFLSAAGPLGVEGVTLPANAGAASIASYGPYVRLRAGTWKLKLRYTLDGMTVGNETFDLAIDVGKKRLIVGPLERGEDQVKNIDLALEHDTSSLELRTFLNPGGHLKIEGLTIVWVTRPH